MKIKSGCLSKIKPLTRWILTNIIPQKTKLPQSTIHLKIKYLKYSSVCFNCQYSDGGIIDGSLRRYCKTQKYRSKKNFIYRKRCSSLIRRQKYCSSCFKEIKNPKTPLYVKICNECLLLFNNLLTNYLQLGPSRYRMVVEKQIKRVSVGEPDAKYFFLYFNIRYYYPRIFQASLLREMERIYKKVHNKRRINWKELYILNIVLGDLILNEIISIQKESILIFYKDDEDDGPKLYSKDWKKKWNPTDWNLRDRG